MEFATEFVSGMAPRDKVVTAAEAVAPDYDEYGKLLSAHHAFHSTW